MAATIDHGLRADAPKEAEMVAELCSGLAIPHETKRVTTEPGNVQDRAREVRYAALCSSFGQRGVLAFATAHHADDQAETVLMRLARGSGLAGLAGIRERRLILGEKPLGEYLVVRPLLHWRRADLRHIVDAAAIDSARDPSNEDDRFDRVRMRERLAEMPWLDPLAVARSAGLLQQAEAAVGDAVATTIAGAVHHEGEVTWVRWGYSAFIQTEVVRHVLRGFGADAPRSAVAQMVEQLLTDGHATLAGVMARRAMYQKDKLTQADAWRFEREPARRTA
jgi:tRNA(Ile)-lysidine synthase